MAFVWCFDVDLTVGDSIGRRRGSPAFAQFECVSLRGELHRGLIVWLLQRGALEPNPGSRALGPEDRGGAIGVGCRKKAQRAATVVGPEVHRAVAEAAR